MQRQRESKTNQVLTSCLGRLFNSVLANRLQDYLIKYNITAPEQTGFIKDSSTSDHILTLQTLVEKYSHNKSQKLYTCFVDFRQAFDRVWHKGLFYKLAKLNNNYFYKIVTNMYNKTKLSIKLHNQITDNFDSTIGVRQGDNLSPSLFNIYINDLPQYIRRMNGTDPVELGSSKINCLMYADDVVLIYIPTGHSTCIPRGYFAYWWIRKVYAKYTPVFFSINW